jgi:hypothetical protein
MDHRPRHLVHFSEGNFADDVIAGSVALPVGDIREPFIDADDIVDVAVAEIAAATGRDLQFIAVPIDEYVCCDACSPPCPTAATPNLPTVCSVHLAASQGTSVTTPARPRPPACGVNGTSRCSPGHHDAGGAGVVGSERRPPVILVGERRMDFFDAGRGSAFWSIECGIVVC